MILTEEVRNSKIDEIYSLKQEIETKEKQKESLDEDIKRLQQALDEHSQALLEDMKEQNQIEYTNDNLVATYFAKDEVKYKDEKEVMKWLQENGYSQFVKTTTTTKVSLDKNPLKKEIKTNSELAKQLESMTIKYKSEYVVVTTVENTERMKQHINENKEKADA